MVYFCQDSGPRWAPPGTYVLEVDMFHSDRLTDSLYTTRDLCSVPVHSFLAGSLMVIRPTMLGLAILGAMATNYVRHVAFFRPLCSPPFSEYLWWVDQLCWD
jgi:hypothetical protein